MVWKYWMFEICSFNKYDAKEFYYSIRENNVNKILKKVKNI